MRFSIRDLLLVTTIVALIVGWSLHAVRYSSLSKETKLLRQKLDTALSVARDTAQLSHQIGSTMNGAVVSGKVFGHTRATRSIRNCSAESHATWKFRASRHLVHPH